MLLISMVSFRPLRFFGCGARTSKWPFIAHKSGLLTTGSNWEGPPTSPGKRGQLVLASRCHGGSNEPGLSPAVKEGSLRMVPKHMADSRVKKLCKKRVEQLDSGRVFLPQFHIQPHTQQVLRQPKHIMHLQQLSKPPIWPINTKGKPTKLGPDGDTVERNWTVLQLWLDLCRRKVRCKLMNNFLGNAQGVKLISGHSACEFCRRNGSFHEEFLFIIFTSSHVSGGCPSTNGSCK